MGSLRPREAGQRALFVGGSPSPAFTLFSRFPVQMASLQVTQTTNIPPFEILRPTLLPTSSLQFFYTFLTF